MSVDSDPVIAPGVRLSHYETNPTPELKIAIVERRIIEWHFKVARALVEAEPQHRQGYAALSILLNIPEALWQFRHGESSESRSARAFREEMSIFLPRYCPGSAILWSGNRIGKLYKVLRCSAYHDGFLNSTFVIDWGLPEPLAISSHTSTSTDPKDVHVYDTTATAAIGSLSTPIRTVPRTITTEIISVNPRRFVDALESHFEDYITEVKGDAAKNGVLYQNFMKAFNGF